MSSTTFLDKSPHFITEPLYSSFKPERLPNGDIRMAIAKAGQKAYSIWGEEATLTEEFLSKDFKTWEDGTVSINHENNSEWVKAIQKNIEYDPDEKTVICSLSGLPEWAISLIYSPDYRGLSQECVPMRYEKNSTNVIRGFGTGVTIVTDPYTPAANQEMGVGIPPALAAILASKYPQKEDYMTENKGDGKSVISTEAYESIVSEKAELKSRVTTLETDNKTLGEELASTKKEYDQYKSGEADRLKSEIEKALRTYDAEVKVGEARAEAIRELNSVYKPEDSEKILSENPSNAVIKTVAAIKKAELSKGVGSSFDSTGDNSEDVLKLVSELRGTKAVNILGH